MGGLKRIRKDDAGIALWSPARRSVKAQADTATAASAVQAGAKPGAAIAKLTTKSFHDRDTEKPNIH
jgi:hypothetical protein